MVMYSGGSNGWATGPWPSLIIIGRFLCRLLMSFQRFLDSIIDLSTSTITFDSRCCIILSMCQYLTFTNDFAGERITCMKIG